MPRLVEAGARGISLLVASGDLGANCEAGVFAPFWPASSPWVTAVGGTSRAVAGEASWSGSTGGFSDRFGMPAWQQTAVAAYLRLGLAQRAFPQGYQYNASGRAFPDVAAQATGFVVVAGGATDPAVAGTSCASPTFAGIVALLVDRRLAAGKPALGFLNPLLYSADLGAALNDITDGASKGCSTLSDGWPALKGWDAVTGHGTPDFGRMAAVTDAL